MYRFAVAAGGHPCDGLKHTVKMNQAGEAAFCADGGNIFIGFLKFSLRIHDSGLVDVLRDGQSGLLFEAAAKVVRAHIDEFGQLVDAQLLGIMVVNIADDGGDGVLPAHGSHCGLFLSPQDTKEQHVEDVKLYFLMEALMPVLFGQKQLERFVDVQLVSGAELIKAAGRFELCQQRLRMNGTAGKIKDEPLKGNVLFCVGIMHAVGRKEGQTSGCHIILRGLQTMLPLSALQKVYFKIIVIMCLIHIVVDAADALNGDGASVGHTDSGLVQHKHFLSVCVLPVLSAFKQYRSKNAVLFSISQSGESARYV